MPVVCPQCHSTIEDAADVAVVCLSCGSTFDPIQGTTLDWNPHKPQRRLGKFELIQEVGAGAFGCVYKARDSELGRTVAVKIPHPNRLGSGGDSQSQRFLREARSVARLRHPSIVPVFEIGQDSGHPFLVSEFIHGVTLDDLITSERVTSNVAADLVAQLADALGYAHSHGVVHRDVKPSNIMLETTEREAGHPDPESRKRRSKSIPRLMDFGLAKHDDGELTMTVDGEILGTPAYMSPEQARGDSRLVDGRTDVYSLGVILYQLLTGELPFKGNSRILIHQVLNEEPPTPRSRLNTIPKDLETVCLKAMAKEPARRYETADALSADLRRFLNDEPILARPIGVWERLAALLRRNGIVIGLTATIVALLGLMIGIVLNGRRTIPTPPVPPPAANHEIAPDTSVDDLLKVVADLDRTDPNWRLEEIEATRPKIPDVENGALRIVEFDKSTAQFVGTPTLIGCTWANEETSKIQDTLGSYPRHARLSDADANAAQAELKRVAPLVPLARKMIDFSRGRFIVQHARDSVSTMLPYHQTGQNLCRLLELDAAHQIHEGNRKEAGDDCATMLNIARYYDTEPILIAQFVRISLVRAAIRSIERLEGQGEGTDEELGTLQEKVEDATKVPVLLTMARGQRGSLHYFFSSFEAGDVLNPEVLKDLGFKDRSELPNGQEIRRVHAWMLQNHSKFAELAKRPTEEQFPLVAKLESQLDDSPLADTPLVKKILFTDSGPGHRSHFAVHVDVAARHLGVCRSASTALAVERYRLANKEWPTDLAALVPEYLKEVPLDPFDGQPLRYRRTFDGVMVYCIGPDRVDNQGSLYRSGKLPEDYDEGFQLWDVAKRGQSAGPAKP